MALESEAKRNKELYGPERNLKFHNIKGTLTKSSVLQDGEYNYTNNKLKTDVWNTSHSRDFSGAELDPKGMPGTKSQLVHHFSMGNMTGPLLDKNVFRKSTTMTDFRSKNMTKPKIHGETKEVNWPDMAPRYSQNRRVGSSEYYTSFVPNLRHRSAPNYPRVDTSKLQLPLNPEKFWKQRNTNFSLGSDNDGLISEQQRAYGTGSMAFEMKSQDQKDTKEVINSMKEMDKVSHVFRTGDYDNIVGNFVTTVNGDYGPRTVPPGEAALQKALRDGACAKKASDDDEEEDDFEGECYANINRLQKHAREVTVPVVFKDASDGRTYQHNAHFKFGHDEKSGQSVYGKDFVLSSQAKRLPPNVKPTPNAGQLLQYDNNQSGFGVTSSSVDFQNHKYEPYKDSRGKTALEMNLDRRDTDNVIFTYDLARHRTDRQKSLNHSDFVGPPQGYKPPPLGPRHSVYVDYLQADEALPYPAPAKDTSEAAHNFSGLLMAGGSAIQRRAVRTNDTKGRLEDGRGTHFVVGYNPFDFSSETQMKFQGEKKTDGGTAPAGKKEAVYHKKLPYLSHSENMLDLKAADPHITNTKESIPARMAYRQPNQEQYNSTSIMKKDYGPMFTRSLTEAQFRVIDKYDHITGKTISDSHLFHTDTSGRNNFVSTAMDDFIKPETMTGGRKYLAAR